MATYIFDIDGVVYNYQTHKVIETEKIFINNLRKNGNKIVFLTRRGDQLWKGHPVFSKEATINTLKADGVLLEEDDILFDIPSPRIIFNDEGYDSHIVIRDKGIDKDFKEMFLRSNL